MKLSDLKVGEPAVIQGCDAKPATVAFLENLGFVEGAPVTVSCRCGRDAVVRIMDSRIALSAALARAIIVS